MKNFLPWWFGKNTIYQWAALPVIVLSACFIGSVTRSAAQAPAPSASGNLAIVTNWGDDNISLIDVDAGNELAKIRVGLKPYDIKVDLTGRYAYVTNSGGSSVSVVDIQAMLEAEQFRVGQSPRDIVLSGDSRRAVVANAGDNTISVVDLVAKRELFRVEVGNIPYGVALANNDRIARW